LRAAAAEPGAARPTQRTDLGLQPATADGRTELLLTPIELLDLLSQQVTPPRLHKHRTCGVLAPNAAPRKAVTASAGPAGATLQLLEEARVSMGLPSAQVPLPPSPAEPDDAGALAAAALVRVRPDARDHGLAGDGPDGGGRRRLGVIHEYIGLG
jgi:hypothetical protein